MQMARSYRIRISQDFYLPVGELFRLLAQHENMRVLFAPAKVTRLRDGIEDRDGVGSARVIRPFPRISFVETVTDFVAERLISYRITSLSPLRDHVGIMRFSALTKSQSKVEIDISFRGRWPGAGLLFNLVLTRSIRSGLIRLAVERRA